MNSLPPSSSVAPSADGVSLRVRVYRYFFYAWLFRDANSGSALERSAALAHNRRQAKWLPTYLFRWAVIGAVLISLERLSERLSGDSLVSAALCLAVIFVVLFHLVTVVSWAFLQASRPMR